MILTEQVRTVQLTEQRATVGLSSQDRPVVLQVIERPVVIAEWTGGAPMLDGYIRMVSSATQPPGPYPLIWEDTSQDPYVYSLLTGDGEATVLYPGDDLYPSSDLYPQGA